MPLFQHQNFLAFELQRQSSAVRLLRSSQVYLSRLRDSLTVASSNLSTWTSQLRALFASTTSQPNNPTALTTRIYEALTTPSLTSYTTVGATVLALLFILARYLMNPREAFSDGRRGRHSPYTSFLASRTSNLSDYVEYLGSNEMPAPDPHYNGGDYHRPSVARPHNYTSAPAEDDEAPDVLILRYKGIPYELMFIPYAISDGKLYVQDVRYYAAEKLRTDQRRLKLIYKGRELTEDQWPAKEYGLKQKSEITCVITDAGGSGDSRSSSDDDSGSGVSTSHGRPRRRHRGPSNARHRNDGPMPIPTPTQSDYLHPSSATVPQPIPTTRPGDRSSRDNAHVSSSSYAADSYNTGYNTSKGHNRAASHSRHSSPAPSPNSSNHGPPTPPTTSADPTSPLGKLQALSTVFHTQWLPQCTTFLISPPSDPVVRDKENKKFNEILMAQIVLKADEIEIHGDSDARMFRKGLVKEVQDLLHKLDGVRKG